MEIQVRGKSYKIPWEYIIAPFIILLTAAILIISNFSSIKNSIIDYSNEAPPAPVYSATAASPIPSDDYQESSQPSADTVKSPEETLKNQSNQQSGKVNINKASMEELMTLPYIGEVKASAIISYRNEYGPFAAIDDLEKIKGIGPKTLEKLKPLVTLE